MAELVLQELEKTWKGGVRAVDRVSLEIAHGEFVVLVGPSGCGKSTLLRLVAGLEEPTAGRIHIGGRLVNHLAPKERDVAMVFQNYALYPHMTVRRNLEFPLRMARWDRRRRAGRVGEVARMLGLDELLDRKPGALSGGQMQRVALGRALVREARVYLFDEPLSNVDAKLRAEMRAELKELHARLGVTMVYVTHDQVEAMTLGDRIAVMEAGRVQQLGAPLDVYHRPANAFVAGFIGSPPMNVMRGRVAARLRPPDAPAGCLVGFRPESAALVPGDAAHVELVEALGAHALVHLLVDGERAQVVVDGDRAPATGSSTGLDVPRGSRHLFDGRSGERL